MPYITRKAKLVPYYYHRAEQCELTIKGDDAYQCSRSAYWTDVKTEFHRLCWQHGQMADFAVKPIEAKTVTLRT
jgi:hypothetical protein